MNLNLAISARIVGFFLVGAMYFSSAQQAEAITIELAGDIVSVDTPLQGTFSVGGAASMVLEFDDSPVNTSTNPIFGRYDGTLSSVSVDGYTFSASSVFMDVFPSAGSIFLNIGALTGPSVGGFPVLSSSVTLADTTNTNVTTTAFPFGLTEADINFSSWNLAFAIIDTNSGATIGTHSVDINLTSVAVSPVPVPAGAVLLSSALGLIAIRRRLKQRV